MIIIEGIANSISENRLIQKKVTPEEVISIHKSALELIYPNLSKEVSTSYDFLIERVVTGCQA